MNDKTTKTLIVTIADPMEMVGFVKGNGTACRFVSMVSQTVVKNIRAASPFKGVIKTSRKRGMINMNYNTAVCKRIAERLGVETSQVEYTNGEVWYEHLTTADGKALPICVNKKTPKSGKYYLQFFPTASENTYHMPDGTPVLERDLEQWFYESKREDFKPVVISISVENIKELRASGVIMQAEDIEEAEQLLAAD